MYQGVSTQYVIRTDAGDTIVAFHQNSERVRDAGVPGSRTRLVWDPQHNVVLAGDPAQPDHRRTTARGAGHMTEDPEAVDVAFLWDPLSPRWSRRRFLQTMGFMAAASVVGVVVRE